ncbi:MAG: glycosyltransferase [Rhizobiaceae bacterium]
MSKQIRVKLLSRVKFEVGQLPNAYPELDFHFDADERDYDWLVIYDDLPKRGSERFSVAQEKLTCSPENTILITYEPSSIRYYGDAYLQQFRYVLTSHEPEHINHPGRIDCPPIGVWYYGAHSDLHDEQDIPEKTEDLSIFLSKKVQRHTTHKLRHDFSHAIADHFGDRIERFGWDYQPVDIKAEALDRFRYTVALENHIGMHHWTEKLSDAFLGLNLPFYAGCPNAADYFPEDSFVPIDMRDVSGAIEIMERAIKDGWYEQRLPAIREAKRRVIEEYNLANVIGRTISQASPHPNESFARTHSGTIISRRLVIRRSPLKAAVYVTKKLKNRLHFLRQNAAYLKQAKK